MSRCLPVPLHVFITTFFLFTIICFTQIPMIEGDASHLSFNCVVNLLENVRLYFQYLLPKQCCREHHCSCLLGQFVKELLNPVSGSGIAES